MICLSKTYGELLLLIGDANILIAGDKMTHSDHPSNTKKEIVRIYYEEWLFAKISPFLKIAQYLSCEVKLKSKLNSHSYPYA